MPKDITILLRGSPWEMEGTSRPNKDGSTMFIFRNDEAYRTIHRIITNFQMLHDPRWLTNMIEQVIDA